MSAPDAAANRALGALPWLAYPLAVWAGLALGGARLAAALVLAGLALRGLTARGTDLDLGRLLLPLAAAGLPALGALLLDDPLLLLFVPVLVNVGLLAAFAFTLWRGPPLIESLARLQEGELSPAEVPYCRAVTVVWCAFFAVNAALTAELALAGSLAAWALWSGALAYLAIGVILAGELLVRAWRFRRYGAGPANPLLRWLFPPRP